MSGGAEILRCRRRPGISGQFSMEALVQYENEDPSMVTFVGNTFGGPVVMITHGADGRETQTFVTNPERFGNFGRIPGRWVARFFEPHS